MSLDNASARLERVSSLPATGDARPGWSGRVVAISFLLTLGIVGVLCSYLSVHLIGYSLEYIAAAHHHWIVAVTPGLFGLSTLLCGLRWGVTLTLSFLGFSYDQQAQVAPPRTWPLVSILVPCFNEVDTVDDMMHSLLGLDYPNYEVLLVDDGSTDQTFERACRFAGQHGPCYVRVYQKPNGGKWSALNFLFHRSLGEFLLCVDADSQLSPNALCRLVPHMADPQVAAVAGYVRVRNRMNTLTWLQTWEYLWASVLRLAQGYTGTVLVVAGPIGLFRRSVLEEVYLRYGWERTLSHPGQIRGPYDGATFAEDFDLSLTILSLGGQIIYEPHAISHTTAPVSVFALLNQRYRWSRGSLQCLRKYFRRLVRQPELRHPWILGWVITTYLMDLVGTLFNLSGLVALLVSLAAGGDTAFILRGYFALVVMQLSTQAYVLMLHRDSPRSLLTVFIYDFYQAILLQGALIISVIDELRGSRMRW
jgi:cellulose synthase/poly-beta-1,6-N-acetylglucosamine synthase-like glycosyltransferase